MKFPDLVLRAITPSLDDGLRSIASSFAGSAWTFKRSTKIVFDEFLPSWTPR